MTTPAIWTGPEPDDGPAPGVEWGSPGARLVGYVVDGLIIAALTVVLGLVSGVILLIFWPLGIVAATIGSLALLLYFPYFWQRSGQTPGMKLMQIKVVRDRDGGPLTWGAASCGCSGTGSPGWSSTSATSGSSSTSASAAGSICSRARSSSRLPTTAPRRSARRAPGILRPWRGGRAVDGGALEKR